MVFRVNFIWPATQHCNSVAPGFQCAGMRRPIDAFSHALLGDSPTLDEVLEYLASRHAADPRYRYLCTLDDVGQCRYTSMHASDDARIAPGMYSYQSGLDAAEHLLAWFPGHADYLDSALAHWMCKQRLGGKPVVLRRGVAHPLEGADHVADDHHRA